MLLGVAFEGLRRNGCGDEAPCLRCKVSLLKACDELDVVMKHLAVDARCKVLGDELVIDQTRCLLNHIEALVMGQSPLWYNLAKFVDGVLLEKTQRSEDSLMQL
jgi:hypothetical protein